MLNPIIMEEMSQVMENQFMTSRNKNIFCNTNQLFFHKDTLKLLTKFRETLFMLSKEQLDHMAYKYQERFLEQFYQINQYTYFNEVSQRHIRNIYLTLLKELNQHDLPLEEIEIRHYKRISDFIKSSNPSIYQINHNDDELAQQFVCAQYSGEFLCNLLNIADVKEPLLDIGCGAHANLVTYLRSMNIEAYGIDRNTTACGCSSIDWFEFDYGKEKWNTIISNLSFTSHFLYHHIHDEDIANQYASTYMEILSSLKKKAQWVYAPSIPFFEDLLPKNLYKVERSPIHKDFSKTVITKL